MPSKPTKKASAKPAKSATPSSSSVVPFAQFGPNASSTSFESMEKIMSSSKSQYDKITADASAAGRQGIEAIIKSGNIFMKGSEQLFKTIAEIAQESTQRSTEAFKTLMACKTLNELTETQNRIAQESFDEAMTTCTKLSEISIRIATDVFEPINDQVSKSIKKASEAMAA